MASKNPINRVGHPAYVNQRGMKSKCYEIVSHVNGACEEST